MGGNALKNCMTTRYPAAKYHLLEKEVIAILMGALPLNFLTPIKSYFLKESFGDMDILLSSTKSAADFIPIILELFRPAELIRNGKVISFCYKDFQIDLIITKPEDYKASINYFSYNDLGNLLGRVAHSMGLKLGHDGLSYNWCVGTHQFKNIILLRDYEKILPVLGYSYEDYSKGFNTLEDIFNFVVSSLYFNKDIYLLQNRNHTSRVRDAKRKTYMEFLTWLKTYQETPNQKELKYNLLSEDDTGEIGITKLDYKVSIRNYYLFKAIPGFEKLHHEVCKDYDKSILYKNKFNGSLVKELTGLENKALGDFMKFLNFDRDFVVNSTQEIINEAIINKFKIYVPVF